MEKISLREQALERAKMWLSDDFDPQTRDEVARLIEEGGEALEDAFYTHLEFGTGGLRGVMGAGTNRMNAYTLAQATQGFANHLRASFGEGEHAVAIAHDCRHNSKAFTQVAADVFASNGFVVYVFDDLRPTPLLSFAIRDLKCVGGVVITASHNPPKYNGYKVYWSDGAQVTAPHDQKIIEAVRALDRGGAVLRGDAGDRIRPVGRPTEERYLQLVEGNVLAPDELRKAANMPIVFTSLHGTAITLLPEALKRIGLKAVHVVEEQAKPDGDFPTVESPNPEEGEALEMAVNLGREVQAELVLGTDPDCDRVGIAVRTKKGTYQLLNGNDTGALLVWYQLMQHEANGTLASNGYVAKTIVTSHLFADIAEGFQRRCYETLTGFKHIAALIAQREPEEVFITGGEESYGYMIGDFVRDKDGVAAACMIAELVAWGYNRGLSVPKLLQQVHETYGLYREALVSVKREGIRGAAEIKAMMEGFRSAPPAELGGLKVTAIRDYSTLRRTVLSDGSQTAIDLPKSNVIQFELGAHGLVTARPSGTEPKIKFYFSVCDRETGVYAERVARAEARIDALKRDFLAM